jgi:hypothetical protein
MANQVTDKSFANLEKAIHTINFPKLEEKILRLFIKWNHLLLCRSQFLLKKNIL